MDQQPRSDRAWACGAHDYAPIHQIDGSVPPDLRLKVRAACGARFRPAAVWGKDPGDVFLTHHGCKRCNAMRRGDEGAEDQ